MQITVITPNFPPTQGGISDFAAQWIDALRRDDAGLGITVLTSPGAPDMPGVVVDATQRGWSSKDMPELERRIVASQPDVVVLHYEPHMYNPRGITVGIGLLAARIGLRYPLLTIAHELYAGLNEGYRGIVKGLPQRAMLVPLVRGSHQVVVTTPDRLRQLQIQFPLWRRKFTLLPVGANLCADTSDTPGVRERLGLPDGTLLLLFLGLAHPSKGLGELVTTLEALRQHGVSARLVIAGGASVDHPDAINLGFVSEGRAAELLGAADMALLPFADGASGRRTSLMNALAAGLPTVSTQGANTDVQLLTPDALHLVPAGDREAFAHAVVLLASDPAQRQRLAAGATRLTALRLSWDVLARQWRGLLDAAVSA